MAYNCSKDPSHQSDDSDYCSICGAKILGAPSLIGAQSGPASTASAGSSPAPAASSAGGAVCPDCGTQRTPGARFCEVCRYDFERKASASTAPPPPVAAQPVAASVDVTPVAAAAASASAPAPPAAPPDSGWPPPLVDPTVASAPPEAPVADASPLPVSTPPVSSGGLMRWEAVVVVDPTLYTDPDPDIPLPTNEPERTFPLDFAENLLGRRSDRKDIHPEIPVNDPGVSHRHAKLLRQPDGNFVLLDVGSTNGTRLNEVEVLPGVRTPLRDGDQITAGCWTRITIRSAGAS